MKLALAALLFSTLATGAMAQTTFGFSGLTWGDSIDTVDTKLKAAGFSGCAMLAKLKCKTFALCYCNFSGSVVQNATASFDEKKLDQVSVNVYDRAATEEVLKQKYGPPLPRRDVSHLGLLGQGEEILTSRWKATTGETLEINYYGTVIYTSGTYNKKVEERNRANASKF